MPRLELFPFRYRDPVTGKWIRARYRAERQEIALRHEEYEITGPAEMRDVDSGARAFSPHSDVAPQTHRPMKDPPQDQPPLPERDPPDDVPPGKEPPEEDPANVEGLERYLLLMFLRRYITWCARHRKFAAMNGAVRLHAELSTA